MSKLPYVLLRNPILAKSAKILRCIAAVTNMNPKNPHTSFLPNGDSLRAMRNAAGMKLEEARTRANLIAKQLNSDIHFSDRAMRRFELIGIDEKTYGKTPPTYAQLNILMRTYNGSPGYLLINVKPILFPWEHFDKHKATFFTDDMVQLMNDIGGWPLARQHQFFEFYKTFIRN